MSDQLLNIASITSPHGLKGEVRIKTFTENAENLLFYGTLIDDQYNEYSIEILSIISKNSLIAKIDNVSSIEDAEKLRNKKLYIKKNQLPILDNEDIFYSSDLIDIQLKLPDESLYGYVKDIKNFNSCDVIEAKLNNGKTIFLPFLKNIFSYINLKEKYAILQLPENLE